MDEVNRDRFGELVEASWGYLRACVWRGLRRGGVIPDRIDVDDVLATGLLECVQRPVLVRKVFGAARPKAFLGGVLERSARGQLAKWFGFVGREKRHWHKDVRCAAGGYWVEARSRRHRGVRERCGVPFADLGEEGQARVARELGF